MCGFGVELRRDAAPDRAALERMHAALAPRGPDGEGIWVDGRAGMVHRRLAIIDLSELGAQPMRDEAPPRRRLQRLDLQPPRAARELDRARPRLPLELDTEVISRLGRVGRGRARPARGHVRVRAAGSGSGRCVLVRDRLGIKPLYFVELPGGVLRVASTLPALLAAAGWTQRRPVALHHYMSCTPSCPPRARSSGRPQAPAGHAVVVEPDGTRREREYWNPAHEREARALEEEWLTRCWRPCASPCGGGWWPTCRSACCSPAGWIRA